MQKSIYNDRVDRNAVMDENTAQSVQNEITDVTCILIRNGAMPSKAEQLATWLMM